MSRFKIYYLASDRPGLKPDCAEDRADISLLRALNVSFEVYYNESRVDFSSPDLGMDRESITVPEDSYSLYIVRNNIDIFREIRGPKVWSGIPYNEEAFTTADAVVTYSCAWKDILEGFNDDPVHPAHTGDLFPDTIVRPGSIISLPNILDTALRRESRPAKVRDYRMKFGGGFVLAKMGATDERNIPVEFIAKIDTLRERVPNLSVVFGGTEKTDLNSGQIVQAGIISFEDMPEAIDACDLLLIWSDVRDEWSPSGLICDAISRQKPALVPRNTTSEELLGSSYPMFYGEVDEMLDQIHRYYSDTRYREGACDYMKLLYGRYSDDRVAHELAEKLRPIMRPPV